MRAVKDLTGMRWNGLVATRCIKPGRRARWEFRCDCGGTYAGMAQSVKCGDVKGCRQCGRKRQFARLYTHGQSYTRLHKIWIGMRMRCHNPNASGYKHYGGRGISICQDWDDFAVFAAWADKNGYAENLEIDRIDVDGDYGAANCRWVNRQTNCRNQRRSRSVIFDGQAINIGDLADASGVHINTLRGRIFRLGMSPEDAIIRRTAWETRRLLSQR